ncbi:wall-associated receptor kinase-like 14 [Iris pallida]|uniref:Wall-associated receptor kinase-like 14 n=1 Tax=Iris pallida TaxID=29817 RepID=A0AAX6HBG2_IRIPA|nr:wall-associated receptor kinase-like 14 [Iris pallida]
MNTLDVFFIIFFLLLSRAQSQLSSNCTDTCGSRKVAYPFGFSSSCPIPLTCAEPDILLSSSSHLRLRNITPDALLVEIPPRCDRPVGSAAASLFSRNFAPTRKNALLFRNCTASPSPPCVISTRLVSDRLNLPNCGPRSDNLTCSTDQGLNGTYSSRDYLEAAGCGFLFSSVVLEEDDSVLVIAAVELGWWLQGEDCRCSRNAACTRVHSPEGPGFRCRCKEGFDGSGFADGGGCYRVVTSCGSTKNHISDKCGSNKIPVLIGGIVAGASLLAGLALLLYSVHRRCSASRLRKYTRRLYSEASFNVPFYSYRDIERATENFSEAHRLGTGAYGTVYVGQIANGELAAVKKIKHPDPESVSHVMNEVRMISSLDHPNLVRLLGCCIERGEQILVYEFMPHGTLSQHLQRQRGPGLPWAVRLSIAAETAKAVAYLHSSVEPPIYHRDVKSSNILLDHHFHAKIADFGLSRAAEAAEASHISTAPQGTPGYVDPQYHQNYHLSDKSDVYSFGVVLAEIITGLKVVDFGRAQCEVNLAALAVDRIAKGALGEIVDPFLRVQEGSWACESIHKVAELAFRCLAFHRDMRPSMTEVADELEQIRLSGWAPKDGDVVVSTELCSSRSMRGPADGLRSAEKSKRLVLVNEIGRMDEFSPVSVQDTWASDLTTASNSSS